MNRSRNQMSDYATTDSLADKLVWFSAAINRTRATKPASAISTAAVLLMPDIWQIISRFFNAWSLRRKLVGFFMAQLYHKRIYNGTTKQLPQWLVWRNVTLSALRKQPFFEHFKPHIWARSAKIGCFDYIWWSKSIPICHLGRYIYAPL